MPTIHSHTQTMPDKSVVDVFKLHKILANRKTITLPTADIQKPNKSKRTGFSKIRSEKADISYPLIIDAQRFLIDGRHRYFKLLEQSAVNVKVVIANEDDIKSATLH